MSSSFAVLDDIPGEDNSHADIPIMQQEFEELHGDHLAIWNKCCHTPEEAKKPFRRSGGFSGTDINPQWRMQKMTEMFGPVGTGWGWKVHDRWSEDFPGGVRCVFVVCSVWFIERGKPSWTGEQIGGTEAGRTPDEAYKMAVTDAIGKCMSALGVGADIYLGQCDSKYQRPEAAQPQTQTYQPAPQQPQYQAPPEPVQQPSQRLPGAWQLVQLHFGKNQGKALGALGTNQLGWYQDKWISAQAGKQLSGQDLALYQALMESMGKSIAAQKESAPF